MPKPKAKSKGGAKAKAKNKAARGAFESGDGDQPVIPQPAPKNGNGGKDVELEKLDRRRRIVLLAARWRAKLEELNLECSMAVEQSNGYEACEELLGCNVSNLAT